MPRRACGCRGDEPRAANPEAAPGLRQRIRRGAPLARLANPIRSPARVQSIRRCLLLTRARTARDSRAPLTHHLSPPLVSHPQGPPAGLVYVRAAHARGQRVRRSCCSASAAWAGECWHAPIHVRCAARCAIFIYPSIGITASVHDQYGSRPSPSTSHLLVVRCTGFPS